MVVCLYICVVECIVRLKLKMYIIIYVLILLKHGSQVGVITYILIESHIALLVNRAVDICSYRIAKKVLQKV